MKQKRVIVMALCLLWLGFSAFSHAALANNISESQLRDIKQQWQSSVHALNEVNCSSCHLNEETQAFIAQPTEVSCQSCHEYSTETFLYGKHGIRLLEGLSPLTPAMAHLPMKDSALDKQMNCNTCHDVHTVNTYQASVDSCLTCHNDAHSLNYKNSPHAQIVNVASLPRPDQKAVTCATCHLPREKVGNSILVNHNNTYVLLPRDRMVRDVCINCHGVEHAYNSIFDDNLVESNFAQPPTLKMQTFQLVRDFEKKRSGKAK